MSRGVVHTKATLAVTGGFLLGGLLTWNFLAIKYAVGSLIGVVVSSDVDVDSGDIADRYIRDRIGKPAERIWDGIWFFYRRSFKHGGELSHFPIVCTIGRIIYLFFIFIVIPEIIFYLLFPGRVDLWGELEWWVRLIVNHKEIVFGLMYADFGHWVLDIFTTEHKKKPKTVSPRIMRPDIWEKLHGSNAI